MQQLAAMEKIDINGDPSKGWKDFEVKVKTMAEEVIENNNQTI